MPPWPSFLSRRYSPSTVAFNPEEPSEPLADDAGACVAPLAAPGVRVEPTGLGGVWVGLAGGLSNTSVCSPGVALRAGAGAKAAVWPSSVASSGISGLGISSVLRDGAGGGLGLPAG